MGKSNHCENHVIIIVTLLNLKIDFSYFLAGTAIKASIIIVLQSSHGARTDDLKQVGSRKFNWDKTVVVDRRPTDVLKTFTYTCYLNLKGLDSNPFYAKSGSVKFLRRRAKGQYSPQDFCPVHT